MTEMDILTEFNKLYEELCNFEKSKIPLCAAETYISPFVRQMLASEFEGKYAMGGMHHSYTEDFIGSSYIHKLCELLMVQCKEMFGATYADARTLSGMNCFSVLLGSLGLNGKSAIITDPAQGGHASVPKILKEFNIPFDAIPYDYNSFQIDYDRFNITLKKRQYDYIIFCQSDVLQPPDLSKIDNGNAIILYDATQTLGLIASNILPNPLFQNKDVVLYGGTHKTLSGPTCGLIMTNIQHIANQIDDRINPLYLRNIQPNNIAALLLALIEQKYYGEKYQSNIVNTANTLGAMLEREGFDMAQLNEYEFSKTHQLFIRCKEDEMHQIFHNALKYNVTLNKKQKELFNGYGIRLGVQEVARYNWQKPVLLQLASLLSLLRKAEVDEIQILKMREHLIEMKKPCFTFTDDITL